MRVKCCCACALFLRYLTLLARSLPRFAVFHRVEFTFNEFAVASKSDPAIGCAVSFDLLTPPQSTAQSVELARTELAWTLFALATALTATGPAPATAAGSDNNLLPAPGPTAHSGSPAHRPSALSEAAAAAAVALDTKIDGKDHKHSKSSEDAVMKQAVPSAAAVSMVDHKHSASGAPAPITSPFFAPAVASAPPPSMPVPLVPGTAIPIASNSADAGRPSLVRRSITPLLWTAFCTRIGQAIDLIFKSPTDGSRAAAVAALASADSADSASDQPTTKRRRVDTGSSTGSGGGADSVAGASNADSAAAAFTALEAVAPPVNPLPGTSLPYILLFARTIADAIQRQIN